jgi:hypothetical protein
MPQVPLEFGDAAASCDRLLFGSTVEERRLPRRGPAARIEV